MSSNQKGTLTIAGSGIASVGHITLDTLSYIREADKVHYAVTDPVTEAFIQDNSKGDTSDLSIYYDKEKNRYDTYIQMSEVMLRDVRAGKNVLAIFYGHPGVFVTSSHRAIAIARAEGFHATMMPGVSAEDCMFADLGFDPAVHGCTTQEATAVLIHNKKLDASVHNIIFQVGSVGVPNMAFANHSFHLLVDRLEEDFGPEHKVTHYIGAVLPQSSTVIEEIRIADLRKEQNVRKLTTISTFYIPPRDAAPLSTEVMKLLGLPTEVVQNAERNPQPQVSAAPAYGPTELAAVARLEDHKVPEGYIALRASPAVRRFMTDLALNHALRDSYKANPAAVVEAASGLNALEKLALGVNQPGPVMKLMRGAVGEEPTRDEILASMGRGGSPGSAALDHVTTAITQPSAFDHVTSALSHTAALDHVAQALAHPAALDHVDSALSHPAALDQIHSVLAHPAALDQIDPSLGYPAFDHITAALSHPATLNQVDSALAHAVALDHVTPALSHPAALDHVNSALVRPAALDHVTPALSHPAALNQVDAALAPPAALNSIDNALAHPAALDQIDIALAHPAALNSTNSALAHPAALDHIDPALLPISLNRQLAVGA